jgi:hypothetical protein
MDRPINGKCFQYFFKISLQQVFLKQDSQNKLAKMEIYNFILLKINIYKYHKNKIK